MKKFSAALLGAAIMLSAAAAAFSASNENETDGYSAAEIIEMNLSERISVSESSYENYLLRYAEAERPDETVSVSTSRFGTSGNAECEISSAADTFGMLFWQGTGAVTWDIDVRKEGLYRLEISYFSRSENNSAVSFGIGIDGEYPFDEAREISFARYWKNKTSIRLDSEHKNQLLPELVKYDVAVSSAAKSSAVSDEPLLFWLSQGEHTLTFYGITTDCYIGSIKFAAASEAKPYGAVRPNSEQLSDTPALIDSLPITVEAEMPKYTNSAVLRPTSDPADFAVSPSHPTYVRYNTIGAQSWNTAGQTLFYEVSVPNEGYYALNIKCRTEKNAGLPMSRRITVNGVVPCKEFDAVEIPYSTDWQTVSPRTDAGELIFIHLNAGKNTIAFEAINGNAGNALNRLDRIISEMINLSNSGGMSGKYGYYHERILDALSGLENASDGIIDASEAEVLAKLLKKYEQDEPSELGDLKKCLEYVCAWIDKNRSASVEMDYFELKTIHEEFRSIPRDFLKETAFNWSRFWGSFFSSGTSRKSDSGGAINVVSDSESSKALKSLSGELDYDVDLSERTKSLLEAALSGNVPDVALFVDEDEIYELASRGLLADLSELYDYEAIEKLSFPGAAKLYEYNGKVYGIPLTNSFPMLFYRTDVLEELGLSVPETWDDLEEILPVLNENGLMAGLGSADTSSSENVFMMMLSQSGNEFQSGEVPDISGGYAKEAFTRYTEFYTKYGCPREYDAVRLFKTGKMPIVIANYAEFYGELSKLGEINGLWSVYHVPATKRTEGASEILDYSTNTSSLGAVIFADSENISRSWELITWFSQPEIQTRFGVMREASSSEIYAPANSEAVSNLRQSKLISRRLNAQGSRVNRPAKSPSLEVFKRLSYRAFVDVCEGKRSLDEAISYIRAG